MIAQSRDQLISALERQDGYSFKSFSLVSDCDCLPTDADWNYKDVPHLKHIHRLVEGYPAYLGDDISGSLFIQKILGGLMRVPLSVVNYQSGKDEQTYFSTLFWFILIIHTQYDLIGQIKTRVTTTYSFGARGWAKFLLTLLFPLMKKSIKKNYRDLMSGDIPMRTRRGELRKMGYTFKGDDKPYSFFNTTKITEANLIPPAAQKTERKFSVAQILDDLKNKDCVLLGEPDLYGVQVVKKDDELLFFPRTCPHEGACLDNTVQGKIANCPWHGRIFKPLKVMKISEINMGAGVFLTQEGVRVE
jgi:nitrite reductase/ring-hydroxylating ferredoxin subunit